jgi:hypothetical protein
MRARLLANGVCGLTVKRKTAEDKEPEEIKPVARLNEKLLKKLGPKVLEEY